MARRVELGTPITDSFPIFGPDNHTKVSGETSFTTYAFVEGVPIVIPITVEEIGTSGEYKVTFTPTTIGFWKIQVLVAYDDTWREVSIDVVSLDAIAQVNVSFDDAVPRMYIEAWLERANRPVAAADLISCQVEAFDMAGLALFDETSTTPKSTGHFSLFYDLGLTSDRPYNLRVTIVDSIGSIMSLHGLATVG